MSITVKNIKGITDLMDMSLGRLQEIVKDWEAWHASVYVVAKSQQQQKLKKRNTYT